MANQGNFVLKISKFTHLFTITSLFETLVIRIFHLLRNAHDREGGYLELLSYFVLHMGAMLRVAQEGEGVSET